MIDDDDDDEQFLREEAETNRRLDEAWAEYARAKRWADVVAEEGSERDAEDVSA